MIVLLSNRCIIFIPVVYGHRYNMLIRWQGFDEFKTIAWISRAILFGNNMFLLFVLSKNHLNTSCFPLKLPLFLHKLHSGLPFGGRKSLTRVSSLIRDKIEAPSLVEQMNDLVFKLIETWPSFEKYLNRSGMWIKYYPSLDQWYIIGHTSKLLGFIMLFTNEKANRLKTK